MRDSTVKAVIAALEGPDGPDAGPPWVARRILADGREITVWPDLASPGGAVVYLGDRAAAEYQEGWAYADLVAALDAVELWDPRDDGPPPGVCRPLAPRPVRTLPLAVAG